MTRYRAGKRLWEPEDDALLRRRYPHERTDVLARELGRSLVATHHHAGLLGLKKTATYLASPDACRLRRDDHVGRRYWYPKGHVPANKGTRRPGYAVGRMKETQFKPGIPSWRTMPVGATRLIDGYVYLKVADVPNVRHTVNWFPLHILNWERANGRPVPPGHCLRFRDGDRTHVDVDNLQLITRAENLARQSVHTLPKPLAQAVQMLGALKRQIGRKSAHAAQK